MQDFLLIDLPAGLTAVLAALACALVGNFLVLRRQALLGDALSHIVLPGIVVGFLISGTLEAGPMIAGALAAALIGAGLIELVRRAGRIESTAAMGVIFTVMFAFGVVMLERTGAAHVHLDVEHALYGNLEGVIWPEPQSLRDLIDPAIWTTLPREPMTLALVAVLLALGVAVFFKELAITSFDAGFAAGVGMAPRLVGIGVVLGAASAAVAAFAAVGSILVIAMLTCPPATARLLTDRLGMQIGLSLLIAALVAVVGYVLAAFAPIWLGTRDSLNAAGMIAVVGGLVLTLAIVLAPRYGLLGRRRRALRSGA